MDKAQSWAWHWYDNVKDKEELTKKLKIKDKVEVYKNWKITSA